MSEKQAPYKKAPAVHVTEAPKKPRQLESKLQAVMVTWFRLQYPQHLIGAIPNGVPDNATAGARRRLEGALPGLPDLQVFVARGGYHGLFAEIKTEEGRLSPVQRERIAQLVSAGYYCFVPRSLDSFMQTVNDYLSGVLTIAEQ